MSTVVRQYIRKGKPRKYIGKDTDGSDKIFVEPAPPKGILIATVKEGRVIIGAALCDAKDEFDKVRGADIALGIGEKYFNEPFELMFTDEGDEFGRFPHSIRGEVLAFVERCKRVKEFQANQYPNWVK